MIFLVTWWVLLAKVSFYLTSPPKKQTKQKQTNKQTNKHDDTANVHSMKISTIFLFRSNYTFLDCHTHFYTTFVLSNAFLKTVAQRLKRQMYCPICMDMCMCTLQCMCMCMCMCVCVCLCLSTPAPVSVSVSVSLSVFVFVFVCLCLCACVLSIL